VHSFINAIFNHDGELDPDALPIFENFAVSNDSLYLGPRYSFGVGA
jgi:hypothetical protein